jgi:hypothetical protein
VQRAERGAGRLHAVERVGGGESARIDEHERVDRRATPVEGVDAGEVSLDEGVAGERAVAQGGVDAVDRRLDDRRVADRCLLRTERRTE